MRFLLALLVSIATPLALAGCDATDATGPSSTPVADAPASSADKSMTCAPPTVAFGPIHSGGYYTVDVTGGSGNVAVSVEEKAFSTYQPQLGASLSNGDVTYVSQWGPPEFGRPDGTVYFRARALCSNGQLSGYSNVIYGGFGF